MDGSNLAFIVTGVGIGSGTAWFLQLDKNKLLHTPQLNNNASEVCASFFLKLHHLMINLIAHDSFDSNRCVDDDGRSLRPQ